MEKQTWTGWTKHAPEDHLHLLQQWIQASRISAEEADHILYIFDDFDPSHILVDHFAESQGIKLCCLRPYSQSIGMRGVAAIGGDSEEVLKVASTKMCSLD